MTEPLVACLRCARYRSAQTCDAFPEQIPEAILLGENMHTRPVEGDGGLTFTPTAQARAQGVRGQPDD